jgi:hypothetical protein
MIAMDRGVSPPLIEASTRTLRSMLEGPVSASGIRRLKAKLSE